MISKTLLITTFILLNSTSNVDQILEGYWEPNGESQISTLAFYPSCNVIKLTVRDGDEPYSSSYHRFYELVQTSTSSKQFILELHNKKSFFNDSFRKDESKLLLRFVNEETIKLSSFSNTIFFNEITFNKKNSVIPR